MSGLLLFVCALLCVDLSAADLRADIHMNGIKGTVTLSQTTALGLITVNFDLRGIPAGRTYEWSIRQFPIHYDTADRCSETAIGLSVQAAVSGSLNSATQAQPQTIPNPGVSLMGNNGLVGRSILIRDNSMVSRSGCATLLPVGSLTTAIARFPSTIGGAVVLRQLANTESAETMVQTNLFYLTNMTGQGSYTWKIRSIAVNESLPVSSRCQNLGTMYNPAGSPGAGCSQSNPAACAVGALSSKLGDIAVGDRINTNRKLYSDRNLPLIGIKSVAGKSMVILASDGQVLSCANIRIVESKQVSVQFSREGVTGDIKFTQTSSLDPTIVQLNLTGLKAMAGGYHVHDYPVPPKLTSTDQTCSPYAVSGHWNPFGWDKSTSPSPGTGTNDQYELGDLSGKYGLLNTLTALQQNFTDWNLPLFGRNSIIGRSVVIHYNDQPGSRWVCANIGYPTNAVRTAVAMFKYPVIGRVMFRQAANDPMSETTIYLELNYGDPWGPTINHDWHVHVDQIGSDFDSDSSARCKMVKGHYNPNNVFLEGSYLTDCGMTNELRCEEGDLANKHGRVNIRTADGQPQKFFFTDVNLPLSGVNSILGRSIVIHNKDGDGKRLSCANIVEVVPTSGMVTSWSTTGPVIGSIHFRQDTLLDVTHITVELSNLINQAGGYHIHNFPVPHVAGTESPCSAASVAGHFNPLDVNVTASPPAGMGTVDQYEIGDISGKFGRLTGKTSYQGSFSDSNLPLSGPLSILGRAVVIHKETGNTRWVCGTIKPVLGTSAGAAVYQARAMFTGNIIGDVLFTQVANPDGSMGDTQVYVDLNYADQTKTMNHNWRIHELPVAIGEGCVSTAGHYNPYHVNVDTNYAECSMRNPLRCELGDLTGKSSTYDIGGGQRFYTDVDVPLIGNFSVLGRSIVVHGENKATDRIACADILPVGAEILSMVITDPKPFSKTDFISKISAALETARWTVNVKMAEKNMTTVVDGSCLSVYSLLLGPSARELKTKLAMYMNEEPTRLGIYAPRCSSAAVGVYWSLPLLLLLCALSIQWVRKT